MRSYLWQFSAHCQGPFSWSPQLFPVSPSFDTQVSSSWFHGVLYIMWFCLDQPIRISWILYVFPEKLMLMCCIWGVRSSVSLIIDKVSTKMDANLTLCVPRIVLSGQDSPILVTSPKPTNCPPNHILIKVDRFGFTANNITYQALGDHPHFRWDWLVISLHQISFSFL